MATINLRAMLRLDKMPAETSAAVLESMLYKYACDHLGFRQHPDDFSVSVQGASFYAERPLTGPIFVISDLHMGDGGPRDNFAVGDHEKNLWSFLDMVESVHGRLIIAGDLFELWQSNISKVLTKRVHLLDRLARMEAIYVLGNHDADLLYFIGKPGWLEHPFFRTMRTEHVEVVNGRCFYFVHGHQVDPFCSSDVPGIGRITAIYSGLREDANGGPMLNKYRTVEDRSVGILETLSSWWDWLRGRPPRFVAMNRALSQLQPPAPFLKCCRRRPFIVCGHTHRPGRIEDWHANAGTWAERVDSFARIDLDATVDVFNWSGSRALGNLTQLAV